VKIPNPYIPIVPAKNIYTHGKAARPAGVEVGVHNFADISIVITGKIIYFT
jgi:hypothetical protein